MVESPRDDSAIFFGASIHVACAHCGAVNTVHPGDALRAFAAVGAGHLAGPDSVQAVRRSPPLICFRPEMAAQSGELKQFLLRNLYRHPQVMDTTALAQQVVCDEREHR